MEIVKPKPPEPPPEKKPEPIKDKPKDDPPKPAPPTPPVNVTICLAGCVCRCNWDHSCRGCQDGQGGHRPCSCGCGGQYRPCQCHCGRGYVRVGGYPPACVGPSHPQLGHNPTWQLICEDQPATACIVM
uniref:Repellent protein 1 n=1 Tax=Anthurium amnicola TaxID=1678845 RepID=A0A1D1Z1K6_9ARAE